MLLLLLGALLLALLTHSWTPLLGAGAVVALILLGARGVCGVLIAVFGSALYIADWWAGLRRHLATGARYGRPAGHAKAGA